MLLSPVSHQSQLARERKSVCSQNTYLLTEQMQQLFAGVGVALGKQDSLEGGESSIYF